MLNKYLILGAIGELGKYLVSYLLKEGKEVALLVNNQTKAREIFRTEYEKLSNVYECDIKFGFEYDNASLLEAIKWSEAIISIPIYYEGNPQNNIYTTTTEIIKNLQNNNKKLILLSSTLITKAISVDAFIINIFCPYALGWLALLENNLRQSTLNYTIIRHGDISSVSNTQKLGISKNKLFELIKNADNNKSLILASETEIKVLKDDISNIIFTDHFMMTRNITIMVSMVLFLFLLLLIWKIK